MIIRHYHTGAYLGNILEYALVDRGTSGGSLHGSVSLKSSNERVPGAEDSCIAFHDGKINSQQ